MKALQFGYLTPRDFHPLLCQAEKRMILRIENAKAVEVCGVTKEWACPHGHHDPRKCVMLLFGHERRIFRRRSQHREAVSVRRSLFFTGHKHSPWLSRCPIFLLHEPLPSWTFLLMIL